jgi:protein-L-isoaspartate(D-aspartate) O-methyltransferase
VVSIERHRSLALGAREALASLAVTNVELAIGDGSRGVPERAPFAAIAVHAAAPAPPPALLEQLQEDGRLVVPIAAGNEEILTVLRRRGQQLESESIAPCRFVPLVGEEGFQER